MDDIAHGLLGADGREGFVAATALVSLGMVLVGSEANAGASSRL